jgi:hypothetical protein
MTTAERLREGFVAKGVSCSGAAFFVQAEQGFRKGDVAFLTFPRS